jgi:hypothetical protein
MRRVATFGDRPVSYRVRWARWLFQHPVVYSAAVGLLWVVLATDRLTVVTVPRVLIGAVGGLSVALLIRCVLVPRMIARKGT